MSVPNWGLGARLTVAMVSLLIPLQLIVLATYRAGVDEQRATEIRDAELLTRTIAAVVGGFASDLENTTLAAALALGTNPEPVNQSAAGPYLAALVRQFGLLRAIFLTDLGGRVVASDSGSGVGTDVSGRPYLQALRGGAETVWSDGVIGIETGEVTVAFGRRVKGPDGATRAFLVAAFYPPRVMQGLPLQMPPDASVVLIDRTGSLLYSSERPNFRLEERNVSGAPGVQAALRGSVAVIQGEATPFPGEPRYGAYAPVTGPGWAVGLTLPQASLEAALSGRFAQQAGAITLVMILAAVLVAVVARRVSQPVGALAESARAITRGEQPAIPSAAASYPELESLAASMQAMAAAVQEREDELRQAVGREQAARAAAEASADTLRRLQRVADAALAHLGVDDLVREVLARVQELLAADTVALFLLDRQANDLVMRAAIGLEGEVERGVRVRVGEGFSGQVAVERRPVALDDLQQADVSTRGLRERGLRSLLGVPLLVEGRLVGVLNVGSLTLRRFTDNEIALLELAAGRVGVAFEHARLFQEAQEAIRARDEFLSTAAHELKTPVTSLTLAAQLAIRHLDSSGNEVEIDRIRRALVMVDHQTDKLTALLNQLFDVSRIEAGKLVLERRQVDVVPIVQQVVATAQFSTAAHSVSLGAPPRLEMLVDPLRFEQVVANLVSNAIKYSPGGGDVEVELSCEGDRQLRLSVTDHGLGIPPERRARIFDHFYQAHGEGYLGGMGLGLYITRQILEQHGGTIDVEFPPGGGTRFMVAIPAEP